MKIGKGISAAAAESHDVSSEHPSIPAAASEKKRRGRPTRLPEVLHAFSKSLFPEIGERQLRDRNAEIAAIRALGIEAETPGGIDGAFSWLAPRGKRYRTGIMSELGRLLWAGWTEDEVRDLARELCKSKLPSKTAVSRLRDLRLRGRVQAGNQDELVDLLSGTIDAYLARRPLPLAEVRAALRRVDKAVETLEVR